MNLIKVLFTCNTKPILAQNFSNKSEFNFRKITSRILSMSMKFIVGNK